ncbi:MAG: ABC transporter substrate-binding protein [Syntrophobacteraceae bacterium]|nr:ABC transporter substrate-binding protein [Syntrophobacteraceae bacterium]
MNGLSRAVLGFGILLLALLACQPNRDPTVSSEAAPGVSDTEVLLGSSLALQGHASFLGSQTFRGYQCYLEHVNAEGGIHGRTIRVIAYDDSYDPPQCLANTQRLIVEDQVFALFSYVGTPTTVKILPLVEEARIPLLGMFTGANALREPLNPYVINVRASYYQETGAAIARLVSDLKLAKIAVFYQYDAFGFDGLTGMELALKQHSLAPVARGSYIRGTLDVEEGLHRIAASDAEAVVMIGTYEPCAKFIRLAREQGFNPIFYTVSFVGAEELARRLPVFEDVTVIMSQVVPPPEGPEEGDHVGAASEYITLLERYFPDDRPNFVGFEGYINAKVLVEGLRRAGRELTREGFIRAIESIRDFPLLPDITLSFGPDDHQGLDQVYFTRLVNGTFVLMKDWASIKEQALGRGRRNRLARGSHEAFQNDH